MQFLRKRFSGEADIRAMENLAGEVRDSTLHVLDLPYRSSTGALQDPDNVHLLVDPSGELVAWMVMQSPFDSLDFCCHPALESALLPQLLEWSDWRSRQFPKLVPLGTPEGKPCWFINVFSDQPSTIQILEAFGYRSQANVGEYSWSKVWMERPADLEVKTYPIPAGFSVRPLAGISEVDAYVNLHRTTFGTGIMNSEWRKRTIQHPKHVPELDLVVQAPDGSLAAFCICWLDNSGPEPVGQIEPLGCHPDFRNLALGRLVLAEGLRRLQSHRAARIYVETDNWRNTAFRLYESLGFKVSRDVLVYRKDYQA